MSLDNAEVVDAIGIEKGSNTVVLSIVDGWDWADEDDHLQALEAKLDAYFGFVESGEIYEAYPDAVGRKLRIDVLVRYPMPEAAKAFLEEVSGAAQFLNMSVAHRQV